MAAANDENLEVSRSSEEPTEEDWNNLHSKYQICIAKFNTACRNIVKDLTSPDISVETLQSHLEVINTLYDEKIAITNAYLELATDAPSQATRIKHCLTAKKDHASKKSALESQIKEVISVLEFEADRTLTDKVLMESQFDPAVFQAVRQATLADKAKQLELDYIKLRDSMNQFCTDDPEADITQAKSSLMDLEVARDKQGHIWISAAVHASPTYYQKALEVCAKDRQVYASWISLYNDRLSTTTLSVDNLAATSVPIAPVSSNSLRFSTPPPRLQDRRSMAPPFNNLHSTLLPGHDARNRGRSLNDSLVTIMGETSIMGAVAGTHKMTGSILERMAGEPEMNFVDATLAKSRKDPPKLPRVSGKDVIDFKNFLKMFECKIHRNPKYSWGEKYYELLDVLDSPAKDCVKLFTADKDGYLRAINTLEARFAKFETHKGALWARITASELNVSKLGTIHAAQVAGMELLANTERSAYAEVGSMLTSLFISRMNADTKKNWQLYTLAKGISDSPTIENFQDWCNYVEREEAISNMAKRQEGQKFVAKPKVTAAVTCSTVVEERVEDDDYEGVQEDGQDMGEILFAAVALESKDEFYTGCPLCNAPNKPAKHQFYDCRILKALRVNERYSLLRRTGTCRNCLDGHHFARNCTRAVTICAICNKEHHPLLHHYEQSTVFAVKSKSLTLFRVVPLDIASNPQFRGAVRINCSLDDHASESYASEDLVSMLGAKMRPQAQSVGYLDRAAVIHNYRAKLFIRSASTGVIKEIMVNTIRGYNSNILPPNIAALQGRYPHLQNLDFDAYENKPCKLLLGLDNLDLMSAVRADVLGAPKEPIARLTKLGWTVASGGSPESTESSAFLISNEVEVEHMLRKLWELESYPELGKNKRLISVQDQKAEQVVKEGLFRVGQHYGTCVPWKEWPPDLPRNFFQVKKWQAAHEAELQADDAIWSAYCSNFEEWINEQYIVPVTRNIISGFYIPCFGVFRNDSLTMKLRVVTDCARKFGSPRRSLNDAIITGPKLQNDIRDVLLHFRSHNFAFTADIARMYLQFHIHEKDREYHRVLFKGKSYEFTRWPFGNVASPFATLFCLNSHFRNTGRDDLITAVRQSLYMDDLLPSRADAKELELLFHDLCDACNSAGLQLRKLVTNSKELRLNTPAELLSPGADAETTKVLGCYWHPEEDLLTFKNAVVSTEEAVLTKRNVFRANGLCFDPTGFLEPVTLKGRLLLQDVCNIEGLKDWDEVITNDSLIKRWRQFLDELSQVSNCKFPRRIFQSTPALASLEVFVDASTRMYSAVLYVREVTHSGIAVSFVTCKRKLCKKGAKSIPEKELLAAHLGSIVATHVGQQLQIGKIRFWSDSTTVLKWLFKPMSIDIPFVSRRVMEVLELTSQQDWNFITSEENPADIATKGVPLATLLQQGLWQSGPSVLQDLEPSTLRPDIAFMEENAAIVVDGYNAVFVATRSGHILQEAVDRSLILDNFEAHANQIAAAKHLASLKNVFDISLGIAKWFIMLRALYRKKRPISYLACARRMVTRLVQSSCFDQELLYFAKHGKWKLGSELEKSAAYITSDFVIRARGRLDSTALPTRVKRPIILQKHAVVELYLRHLHSQLGHNVGANQFTLILRRHVYVPKLRQILRKMYKNCAACQKLRGTPIYPEMGDRVIHESNLRPFSFISMDFCGPFTISRPRGQAKDHRYVLVIVCQQTKACHIEDVYDLTTDAFVSSFARFCARRGYPQQIRSDQGTNFVGAANLIFCKDRELIRKIDWEVARRMSCDKSGLTWSFSPASAPEFNGLSEIFVRLFKKHLSANLTQSWREDTFRTALAHAEELINSRPLSYVPEDQDGSCEVVSPNSFLMCPQEHEAPFHNDTLLDLQEYRKLKMFKTKLWHQWMQSVYHDLASRPKWRKVRANLNCGDVVIIRDRGPFSHRSSWPLGVVVEVHKDKNGVNRTVKLRVANTGAGRADTKPTKVVVESLSNVIPLSLSIE